MSDNRAQTVGLGCGTLIVIALIVYTFGSRGVGDLEKEVKSLRAEVVKLREAPPAQVAPVAPTDAPSPSIGPNLDLDRLQSELREMREAIDSQNGQLKAIEEKLDRLAAPAAN